MCVFVFVSAREKERGVREERERVCVFVNVNVCVYVCECERERERRERPVSFFDRAATLSQRDQERQNFNRFFPLSLSSIFFLNECVKRV